MGNFGEITPLSSYSTYTCNWFLKTHLVGLYQMDALKHWTPQIDANNNIQTIQAGWWFLPYFFYVHPYLGKIPILTNIFQMGWNHQLVHVFVAGWLCWMFSSTLPNTAEYIAQKNRWRYEFRSWIPGEYEGLGFRWFDVAFWTVAGSNFWREWIWRMLKTFNKKVNFYKVGPEPIVIRNNSCKWPKTPSRQLRYPLKIGFPTRKFVFQP